MMKFSVDVDCTPQEAREFLGLPDVSQAQGKIVAAMVAQVEGQMGQLGMEEAMKMMFGGGGIGGLQDAQKAFWAAFGGAKSGS